MNQGERLARIEALLEDMKSAQAVTSGEVKTIRIELQADKADLATLKNRGFGLLVGVALVAAALGGKLYAIINAVLDNVR